MQKKQERKINSPVCTCKLSILLEIIKMVPPIILAGFITWITQKYIFDNQTKREDRGRLFSEYLIEEDKVNDCSISIASFPESFFSNGKPIITSENFRIYQDKIKECKQRFQKLYFISIDLKLLTKSTDKKEIKDCIEHFYNLRNISRDQIESNKITFLEINDKYNWPMTSCWKLNKYKLENLVENYLLKDSSWFNNG